MVCLPIRSFLLKIYVSFNYLHWSAYSLNYCVSGSVCTKCLIKLYMYCVHAYTHAYNCRYTANVIMYIGMVFAEKWLLNWWTNNFVLFFRCFQLYCPECLFILLCFYFVVLYSTCFVLHTLRQYFVHSNCPKERF